jgi:tryptophanyl-tRNA synthetase
MIRSSLMNNSTRKVVLSGIQPTGIPHLGNYLGALKEWSKLSQENKNQNERKYFSLMNLHAITIHRPKDELKRDIFDGACTLLGCGIKPSENCAIFIQSEVPQHLELMWILLCLSKYGQLQRMTQFKDKSVNKPDHEMGLLV